jgi:prolipoprotein diacylglyceryltransferase
MFPELLKIGDFTIYTYGVMLAIAYLSAIGLSVWNAKKPVLTLR